ncbi:MAG: SprT family zinc-dependent metalloprotease [Candidatus Diapherotrites archaeon]
MNIEKRQITVNDITIEVVRKAIKNLHLGVYPPHGRVRVAAPLAVSDDAVRLAVIGKLAWIKRQQAKFEAQRRQSKREMVNGESHYFLGRRYRLRIIENRTAGKVVLRKKSFLDLYVRPEINAEQREQILLKWYRQQLKGMIPSLLGKWQSELGVQVSDWGIKKMKTKWGACNIDARRIWLNLELAKKPVQCLEYILVHELVHLLERHHNDRFQKLMDQFMPQWRLHREELNRAPLAHENWDY